jgi:subtilisin-like proprotein convertase family protein
VQNTPALQLLLEQPSAGEWQLQVVDSIAGDTGTLNSWRLSIGI